MSNESRRRSYLLGTKIAGDFGASIAVPAVVLVILGKWLQTKYDFAPYGIIVGFVLAAVLSGVLIYRRAKWYACEYKGISTKECKKL